MGKTFTTSAPKQLNHSHGVAWTAVLFADGVKVGMVENAGRGGCDTYSWAKGVDRESIERELHEAASAVYATGATPFPDGEPIPVREFKRFDGGDYNSPFIEILMGKAEFDKKLKADCKKHVCARLPGQSHNQYSVWKNVKLTPVIRAAIEEKYPGAVVLNDQFNV